MSKTYNREYWHNRETKKSVWIKPQEVIDYEKEKEEKRKEKEEKRKEQEEKKRKEKEEQRKIWKRREEEFFHEHEQRRAAREKAEKAEKESYGMQIVNGNGMSWTIEGGAHWTKDDYMEELRNYNQALRDF